MNAPTFDYQGFKDQYDADPVIQALVHRFDDKGVELKTKNTTKGSEVTGTGKPSAVSQMAKRATNIARNRA